MTTRSTRTRTVRLTVVAADSLAKRDVFTSVLSFSLSRSPFLSFARLVRLHGAVGRDQAGWWGWRQVGGGEEGEQAGETSQPSAALYVLSQVDGQPIDRHPGRSLQATTPSSSSSPCSIPCAQFSDPFSLPFLISATRPPPHAHHYSRSLRLAHRIAARGAFPPPPRDPGYSTSLPNPFAVVTCDGAQTFTTQVVKKTLNPYWSESVDLYVPSPARPAPSHRSMLLRVSRSTDSLLW